MLFLQDPLYLLYICIALTLGVTVHEFCHAWMATYLGDPTPGSQGRVSMNPKDHLDLVGTLLFFIAGFGWGKPVQINPLSFRHPRQGEALVSIVGPASNLLIALVFVFPFRYLVGIADPTTFVSFMAGLFAVVIQLNLVLMLLNFIPIHPLDGAKIFSLLLPERWLTALYPYRQYGLVVLLVLVFSHFLIGVDLLGRFYFHPMINWFWNTFVT